MSLSHFPTAPNWVTIPEAADHYKVSTKTVRRMIARGEIEAKRVGPRLIRINLAAEIGRPLQYGGASA